MHFSRSLDVSANPPIIRLGGYNWDDGRFWDIVQDGFDNECCITSYLDIEIMGLVIPAAISFIFALHIVLLIMTFFASFFMAFVLALLAVGFENDPRGLIVGFLSISRLFRLSGLCLL
jgi:hypothetical protein